MLPGDMVLVAFSLGLSNGGLGNREILWKYMGAVPVMTGGGATTPTRRQIEICKAWGVNVVLAFPSYLRHLALSRIYLDNIPNIQSSWVTQGQEIGQVALKYGANDLGSIMIEENVVSQAGTTFRMGVEDMKRLIQDLGYEPRQRDDWYHLLN